MPLSPALKNSTHVVVLRFKVQFEHTLDYIANANKSCYIKQQIHSFESAR